MRTFPHPLRVARRSVGATAGLMFAVVLLLVGSHALAQGTPGAPRSGTPASNAPPADPTDPPGGPPPPAIGRPGRVLVSTGVIHGWTGMKLMIRATTLSGLVGARLCVDITDDEFALRETSLQEMPADQDACGGATAVAEFPAGDAFVSARVVRPGQKDPLASVAITVTVNGDTPVALDGARLSRREHKHPATPIH
ncbi:MAG: hypothetical protein IPK07_11500 [Deltaproteobacteria bacterium]|nr:hypothetical protein [Deltaproteobacteria bacterium]